MAIDDNSWPAPLPGAPCTERSLLTLRFAREAAEGDAVAAVVTNGAPGTPRDLVRDGAFEDALRAFARAQDMLDTAVLGSRADGADWSGIAEIATAYGQPDIEVSQRAMRQHRRQQQRRIDGLGAPSGAGSPGRLCAWSCRPPRSVPSSGCAAREQAGSTRSGRRPVL